MLDIITHCREYGLYYFPLKALSLSWQAGKLLADPLDAVELGQVIFLSSIFILNLALGCDPYSRTQSLMLRCGCLGCLRCSSFRLTGISNISQQCMTLSIIIGQPLQCAICAKPHGQSHYTHIAGPQPTSQSENLYRLCYPCPYHEVSASPLPCPAKSSYFSSLGFQCLPPELTKISIQLELHHSVPRPEETPPESQSYCGAYHVCFLLKDQNPVLPAQCLKYQEFNIFL